MATLEKIRSKSVLLIIIIGVALLAFIIGDAITNSRNLFGDRTTVAKVGNQKIDYTDYISKREELNAQLEQARRQNPAQYANFDPQILSQMAIEQLMQEALLDDAAQKAGLRTTPAQLSYFILENPINPKIRDIMQQLNVMGLNVATPQQAYDVIFNPVKNNVSTAQVEPLQRAWVAMEQETGKLVNRQNYQQLLSATIKANELDKKAIYNDYVNTMNVELAIHPYGQLNPEQYPVADNDVRQEYENVKNRFKVKEPTKDVAFIAVNVAPSQADRNAAKKLANATVKAMRSKEGISKDLRKEGIVSTRKELRESDLKGAVKDYVLTASQDSVKVITENVKGFTVVKMGKKTVMTDSLQLNLVQVMSPSAVKNVMGQLNGGLAVDSINTVFSKDTVSLQKDVWIQLFSANGRTGALEQSQVDSLNNAGGKFIELVTTPQGSVLAQLVNKTAPVTIYEYEEVNYDLKPSTLTLNEERMKLEDFLSKNKTAKEFLANASTQGYNVQNLSLNSSMPAVPRMPGMQNSFYPESRQVVRWVMVDGKPGEVSHIYESKDAMSPALYAVAVVNEYDDYAPLTNVDVNKYVSDRVRKTHVGDSLINKYTPSKGSVTSLATAMNVEATNDSTFRFGRNSKIRDAAVVGQIAGSQPGKVVLVKGDNGVYGYKVVSTAKESFPYNDSQYEQQYYQMVNPDVVEMLKGNRNVKNNIYKFEAGD